MQTAWMGSGKPWWLRMNEIKEIPTEHHLSVTKEDEFWQTGYDAGFALGLADSAHGKRKQIDSLPKPDSNYNKGYRNGYLAGYARGCVEYDG